MTDFNTEYARTKDDLSEILGLMREGREKMVERKLKLAVDRLDILIDIHEDLVCDYKQLQQQTELEEIE